MSTKVLIEVVAKHEAILRRALALAEEKEQLALTTPDGTVFDACEGTVLQKKGAFCKIQRLGEAAPVRLWRSTGRGKTVHDLLSSCPSRWQFGLTAQTGNHTL